MVGSAASVAPTYARTKCARVTAAACPRGVADPWAHKRAFTWWILPAGKTPVAVAMFTDAAVVLVAPCYHASTPVCWRCASPGRGAHTPWPDRQRASGTLLYTSSTS